MPDDNRTQGPSNDAPRDPLDDLIDPILNRNVPAESTRAAARPSASNRTRRDPLDDLLTDADLRTEVLQTPVRAASSKERAKRTRGKRLYDRALVIVAICLFGTAAAIVGETQFGPRNRWSVWNQPQSVASQPTQIAEAAKPAAEQNPAMDLPPYIPPKRSYDLGDGIMSNDEVEALLQKSLAAQKNKSSQEQTVPPAAKPAPSAVVPQPLAQKLTPEELYEKVSPSVVRVNVRNARSELVGHGSGFFVRDNFTVVTNFHVIEHGHSAEVVLSDGTTLRRVLGVEAFDMRSDVAILKLNSVKKKGDPRHPLDYMFDKVDEKQNEIRPLALGGDELPRVASKAYVIGAPEGLDNSASDGLVSGHREMDGRTWIQTTAPISAGSSGSPVFNELGLVIGVATKSRVAGQNLNFALAARHLRSILSDSVKNAPIKLTELPSRKPPQGQAADPAKPAEGDIFATINVATRDAASLSPDARKRAMRTILERLESVPAEEKRKVAYWTALSDIHFFNGRSQLALDAADEAVRIDPKDKRGWHSLGMVLQHPSGDLERKRLLEIRLQIIQLEAENAKAWHFVGLGNAFRELGKYDEAVASYGRALVRDPTSADAYYGLGNVHRNRRRYMDAVASYKKSIEVASNDWDAVVAHLGLASCYEQMRDIREAIRATEKALELLPAGFDEFEKGIRQTLLRLRGQAKE